MSTATQTNESIHGHAVIEMIQAGGAEMTRQRLAEQVRQRFGEGARFHTCSAGGLTLDGLLQFLAQRGKLIEAPSGALRFEMGRACDHG